MIVNHETSETHETNVAQAFDELAAGYDHDYHDAIASALIGLVGDLPTGLVADAACGAGAVALALAKARGRTAGAPPIIAVDLSPAMIAVGRARAEQAGCAEAIDWRIGSAVPLPVDDAELDLVLCASSLHFLGAAALQDWRRALRPGGRAAFTLPLATSFRPSGTFAQLVAKDLPLAADSVDAHNLAVNAGFASARAQVVTVAEREIAIVVAEN